MKEYQMNLIFILSQKTVSITIEERASAEFQVQLEFINQDELPFGYELGETTIEPETITVTSSRSLIEQIAIVKVYIDVEGLTEPINKREVPINRSEERRVGKERRARR